MKLSIQIPTTLDDVTLGQYLKFRDIPEELPDARYSELLIQCFCNLHGNEVRNMTEHSRRAILTRLRGVINTSEHAFVERVNLNGLELGFIPNLDNMTFGEFVDIETNQEQEHNWHKLMRVFYRPIISEQYGRYEIESYAQTLKRDIDYKQMPMSAVLGAFVFFCRLGNELLKHTVRSLEEEESKAIPHKPTSPENGDGTGQSLASLTAMYLALDKLQNNLCINA